MSTGTRVCLQCAAPVAPLCRYCPPCRRSRAKASTARYRAGLNMAPGEVGLSRSAAVCGLREVAAAFQLTRSRIQQIERVALVKLRAGLMPFVAETNPTLFKRMKERETPAQQWLARRSVRRQLSARQSLLMAQMRELASMYEKDGQTETAAEIRGALADLRTNIDRLFHESARD